MGQKRRERGNKKNFEQMHKNFHETEALTRKREKKLPHLPTRAKGGNGKRGNRRSIWREENGGRIHKGKTQSNPVKGESWDLDHEGRKIESCLGDKEDSKFKGGETGKQCVTIKECMRFLTGNAPNEKKLRGKREGGKMVGMVRQKAA